MKIRELKNLQELRAAGLAKLVPERQIRVAVGMGTCGMGTGAEEVFQALAHELERQQVPALLTQTGCFGCCALEPLVNVRLPGQPLVIFSKVTRAGCPSSSPRSPKARSRASMPCAGSKVGTTSPPSRWFTAEGLADIPRWNEVPFFKWQKKIVLRDSGLINPTTSRSIWRWAATGRVRGAARHAARRCWNR